MNYDELPSHIIRITDELNIIHQQLKVLAEVAEQHEDRWWLGCRVSGGIRVATFDLSRSKKELNELKAIFNIG